MSTTPIWILAQLTAHVISISSTNFEINPPYVCVLMCMYIETFRNQAILEQEMARPLGSKYQTTLTHCPPRPGHVNYSADPNLALIQVLL